MTSSPVAAKLKTMQNPNAPTDYRLGVGIMLLNPHGQVFTARRIDNSSEAWQMPQGGIDHGELPEQALWREMMEEIGTQNAEIIATSRDWLSYDLPQELAKTIWGGWYRGQRQKWFLMRFLGEDGEINIQTDKPEFNAWQWLAVDQLESAIVPFKRTLYRQIIAEFSAHLD